MTKFTVKTKLDNVIQNKDGSLYQREYRKGIKRGYNKASIGNAGKKNGK